MQRIIEGDEVDAGRGADDQRLVERDVMHAATTLHVVAPGMVDGPRFREKVCADMAKKLNITVEEAAERHAAEYALKRVTTDNDVANACLFFASDVSRQITGADLPVDGGWAAL